MADMLRDIFERQVGLQNLAYDKDLVAIGNGGGETLVQEVKDNILALSDELHEALAEVGWKAWASSRHMNADAFKGELVDALHFFVNLYALAGGDADDLYERYLAKNRRNLERQLEGYDGVSGKCKSCHRALDDPAVKCTDNGVDDPYCSQK